MGAKQGWHRYFITITLCSYFAVVLLDLPAHKVVTGSMSNHFRKRLMQFEQQMQRDVYAKGNDVQAPNNMQLDIKLNDSPRERLVASARMAAPGVAILDEIIPADWLPAAEIVLKFMYTQELCKPDNVMLLITVSPQYNVMCLFMNQKDSTF